ncbi:MAG: arginase family protein [Solirubrobacteraceae bacterium]
MAGPLSGPGPAARSDEPALVGLRCRISEPVAYAHGAEALARALGARLGTEPRFIGEIPADGPRRLHSDDLRDGRGCLLEAGGQVDDALSAGRFPILTHGDCSIAMGTLPALARLRPDARVLWLDAHADFNVPEESPSDWLGGMGLAGACGRWDPGLGLAAFEPDRLVLCGVRDLDEGEREALEHGPATVIGAALETLVFLANALDGAPVYVHVDPDVLDPSIWPCEFPAPDGLSFEKLYDLLEAVAGACEVIGLEVASYWAPADPGERAQLAEALVDALEPLLPAG